MRLLIVAFSVVLGAYGIVVAPGLAAQNTPIRLEGDGRLGPEADERRGTSGAHGYEGTPYSVVPEMVTLAAVDADDVVFEPGCGDARILIAAVEAGARKGIGVDIDPDLAEVSYANVRAAGLEDAIEIYWGNALDVDMSETTVVFLFMGNAFNRVIRPLLWQQLKVGARVVSNDFSMGDWEPDTTVRVYTPDRSYTLYRWTITPEVKAKASRP